MNGAELASRSGTRFGPYQLMQLLGRGGMGEVYQAEDTRKHRVVALKLISPQFSNNSEFRARMQREADTAGRLTEPHIVPIHDYGEIDGQFFVEMRLIAGASLRTMLKHYGPLTPARTVAVVRQIAAALDAAHSNGVTHRDVKPENILIGGNDFAYLVDFGIARAATDPGLTQVGTAIGTYNYMAPERFTGTEVTYRADIYALACVLGECLTGAPPYHADSVERLIAAHLLEPVPRPSLQLRPGMLPPALDEVIARGMAKIPEERYRTAGDLAAAAHDALTGADQHLEATILRQGDNAPLFANPPETPGAAPLGRDDGGPYGAARTRRRWQLAADGVAAFGRLWEHAAGVRARRVPARPETQAVDHRRRRRCAARLCHRRHRLSGHASLVGFVEAGARTNRGAVQRHRLPALAGRGGAGQSRRCVRHQRGHVRAGGGATGGVGHSDGVAVQRSLPAPGAGG